jgi:DNA polymerase elongation subunit (family B)
MEVLVIGWTTEEVLVDYVRDGMLLSTPRDVVIAWCLTKDSKRVTIRMENFRCELGIRVGQYASVYKQILSELHSKFPNLEWGDLEDTKPIKMRRPMFFYSEGEHYLVVRTPTHRIARQCTEFLKSGELFATSGNNGVQLEVSGAERLLHEHLTSRLDLLTHGWYTIKDAYKCTDDPATGRHTLTRTGYGEEYRVDYMNVKSTTAAYPVNPVIFAYDLEVNSADGKSFPQARFIGDYVGMASIVVWNYGKYEETKKEYLIVKAQIPPIGEGVEVICVEEEEEAIDKFNEILAATCPVVITHYNGDSFDTQYLEERNDRIGTNWKLIGAHKRIETQAAYLPPSMQGRFRRGNVLIAPGVCNYDMMKHAIENLKLRSYSLDSVANSLIKKGKVNIGEYTAIFDAFRAWDEQGDNGPITEIAKYGMEDSRLTAEIFEHQKAFDTLIAMAQASEVTCDTYSTKGRMKRTLGMINKQCYKVKPRVQWETGSRLKPQLVSGGGYVAIPKIGLYDYIVTYDFNSLYPSIMASFWLCFTSLLSPVAAAMSFPELQKKFPSIKSPNDIRHIRCDQADGTHRYKIVKTAETLLPSIVMGLLARRRATNAERGRLSDIEDVEDGDMKQVDEAMKRCRDELKKIQELREELRTTDDVERIKKLKESISNLSTIFLLHLRQLSLKIAANSVYGFTNAPGDLSAPEITQMVTALGRMLITWARDRMMQLDDCIDIYGDTDSNMLHFRNCKSYADCLARAKRVLDIVNKELEYIETNDNGDLYIIPEDKRAGVPKKVLKFALEKITRGGFVTGKGYFMIFTDLKKDDVPFYTKPNGKLAVKITGLPCVKRDRPVGFCEIYEKIGVEIMHMEKLKKINEMVWEMSIREMFDMSSTKKGVEMISGKKPTCNPMCRWSEEIEGWARKEDSRPIKIDTPQHDYTKFVSSGRIGKPYGDDSNAGMAELYHRLARENTPLSVGVRFDYTTVQRAGKVKAGARFATMDEVERNRKRREEGQDLPILTIDRRLLYTSRYVNVMDTMISALLRVEGEEYHARQHDTAIEAALSRLYLQYGRVVIDTLQKDPNPCIAIGCSDDVQMIQDFRKYYNSHRPLCLITTKPARAFATFLEARDRVLVDVKKNLDLVKEKPYTYKNYED